ncbi:MAG TPA: NlpC/P60 family protein [Terriglobales bacterium]|nr:NlpC/P60 family protein [Terriglobales bacterium]
MKRNVIVECARTYVGTPFVHQGRVKGVGIDCVGLPLMVAEELGLKDKRGEPLHSRIGEKYSHQPQGNLVHETVGHYINRKAKPDMKAGDVVTMRFAGATSHAGIIGDSPEGLTLIHAYSGEGEACVEHLLNDEWRNRIVGVFEFPEVEE